MPIKPLSLGVSKPIKCPRCGGTHTLVALVHHNCAFRGPKWPAAPIAPGIAPHTCPVCGEPDELSIWVCQGCRTVRLPTKPKAALTIHGPRQVTATGKVPAKPPVKKGGTIKVIRTRPR